MVVASIAEGHFVPECMEDLDFIAPSTCENNHGVGLCCQDTTAMMKVNSEYDFDYAFIIDDDVYLWPSILREVIQETSKNPLTVLGSLSGACPGFCGGGGVGFTRQALKKMVEKDNFEKRYHDNCVKTQFTDVTMLDVSCNQARLQARQIKCSTSI